MERLKGYTTLPFHSTLRVLHLQVESAFHVKEMHDQMQGHKFPNEARHKGLLLGAVKTQEAGTLVRNLSKRYDQTLICCIKDLFP